jgi:hypothetical protein
VPGTVSFFPKQTWFALNNETPPQPKTIKPSNSPFKIHHSTFSEAAVGRRVLGKHCSTSIRSVSIFSR